MSKAYFLFVTIKSCHNGFLQSMASFTLISYHSAMSKKLLEECDACKAGLMAPILHFHNHYNLLDMMKKYTKVAAPEIDVKKLFNSFIVKSHTLKHLKNCILEQGSIF